MRYHFLVLLFLFFTLSGDAQPKDNSHSLRLYGQADFAHGSFYPQLGIQYQLSRNSFLHGAVSYGTTGEIHKKNTWWQNSDGSFSPEEDLTWYMDDSSASAPLFFNGMRENLDLSFQAFTFYAQYQVLLIGYIKDKNKYLSFISGGLSWSEVKQSGKVDYLDLSNTTLTSIDASARFHSFSPDIELTLLYEHKSGFGIRAGARMTFGFPLNDFFKLVYGTTNCNLYSGLNWNAFAGISFKF